MSLKRRLIARNEREARANTAEAIAQAIEASVAGPGECCEDPSCPDRQRFLQGAASAAMARQIGGTT